MFETEEEKKANEKSEKEGNEGKSRREWGVKACNFCIYILRTKNLKKL